MKTRLLIGILLAMITFCFADGNNGGYVQKPPVTNFLINDRIRNTPAVDTNGQGSDRRFYVTTFGLTNFDPQNQPALIPLPRNGSLIRFGIQNATGSDWQFSNTRIEDMNGDSFAYNDIKSNSYTTISEFGEDSDEYKLENTGYPAMLTYTDGSIAPEGHMRFESGTGCWASPVLDVQNGRKNLIILNKSGCLMSVNVSGENSVVNWKINLRSNEGNLTDSYKFEYMSTPVIDGNSIYLAGIKSLFEVNLSTGIVTQESTCLNAYVYDYFDSPLVFDTASPRSFYAVSTQGRVFCWKGGVLTTLQSSQGVSCAPPLLDSDGNLYVASWINGVQLSYIGQENRSLTNSDTTPYGIHGIGSVIKSQMLTDNTQNMYMLIDGGIIRMNEQYQFGTYNATSNPTDYTIDDLPQWYIWNALGAERFPGNHSILEYHTSTNQSMIFSISNSASSYNTSVLGYYPSFQTCNLTAKNIYLSYICYNNSYQANNSTPVTNDLSKIVNHQSWGGVAPYLSLSKYYNALFGDENGCITSYNESLDGNSVRFNCTVEEGASIIPEMGCTKFMKNLNNVPTNNEVPFNVYIIPYQVGLNPLSFADAYVRTNSQSSIPNTTISCNSISFESLLPNDRYQITWKNTDGELVIANNVEVSNSEQSAAFSAVQDLEVNGHVTIDWQYPELPLNYNSVRITPGSSWIIGFNSHINVNTLTLMDDSQLTIEDGARLEVFEAICDVAEHDIVFDVDGSSGQLHITGNLEISNSSNVTFKGYNLAEPSYHITTLINKPNAKLKFLSANTGIPILASASIGSIQNHGNIIINDCISNTFSYNDDYPDAVGTFRILDNIYPGAFGSVYLSGFTSKFTKPFKLGNNSLYGMNAKFTIENSECSFSGNNTDDVYGTFSIDGQSSVTVSGGATLFFHNNSHLKLQGDEDVNHNGAELVAKKILNEMPGTIKFDTDVQITGCKPDPDPTSPSRYGDRIRTDRSGKIVGTDAFYPNYLNSLVISSTNSANYRWEGIYINTLDNGNISINNCTISGIDKIYLQYPGNPTYTGSTFFNCKYGIYLINETEDPAPSSMRINNCIFYNNEFGIYIEDMDMINNPQLLKADISDCIFGFNDVNANKVGISLSCCAEASIQNCDFNHNGYGIFGSESVLLVGGIYDSDNNPIPSNPCNFYNNSDAGIYLEHSTLTKSLIMNNLFTGVLSTSTNLSGIGIRADDAMIDIIGNDFYGLTGHGMLARSYTRTPRVSYHGFASNRFMDNLGCELIGDAASLSSSKWGLNEFNDSNLQQQVMTREDPLEDFPIWDQYILAILHTGDNPIAYVSGNSFVQDPLYVQNHNRFYPRFDDFNFGVTIETTLTGLISAGMTQFYQGLIEESMDTMKQAICDYPDSTLTNLAIDFLFLSTRASSQDYSALRAYLDLKIPSEGMETYYKKEETKTKCYVNEKDYPTAIQRLQLIIDNPETVADSLFSLIDQAYCYMSLAKSGAKALPNISVQTSNFESYVNFMLGLGGPSSAQMNHNQIPANLTLVSNYPNPFNPSTTISFSIPKDGKVNLAIYNIRGQRVNELINENLLAGSHKIVWNSVDSNGKKVSSGIYFTRVEHKGKTRVNKMVLLK